GLHVAALAGVPPQVIRQAQARLQDLEQQQHAATDNPAAQIPLFQAAADHPALTALEALDIDSLSPREALQALYLLHDLAKQELHS
ncbi:MAG: hypothetical protein OEU91_11160, partial [Gammaproteobacteria bacterium]|nr:hypothetical protein [Gammaproteobacteria bacterium]